MNQLLKKILFLALLAVAIDCYAQNPTVIVGPYLQSPTPSGIKVMWRTDSACTGKVMYGTSIGNLTQQVTESTTDTRHMVELTGLAPFTRYYYAIYNDGNKAEGDDADHTFRTFPTAGTQTHVRAWAIGDFGKGNSKQAAVRDAYINFDTTETDLWLWLGDNAYDSGLELEYLTKVWDSVWGYQKVMKHLPFEPIPGNHDYMTISPVQSPSPPLTHDGPYYQLTEVYKNAEAGGVASGHELFYSYNYGNVHFVGLNSELGSLFNSSDDWIGTYLFGSFTSSPMSQWLHQDLSANTLPWVVVYFHQPPYTDGSHDASSFWEVYMQAMRENFAEIWEQYGVDLVLCGHSHVYERSYLVKGAYGDVSQINSSNILDGSSGIDAQGEAYIKYTQTPNPNQGTVYVVQGNSGSSDSGPSFNHPYMYAEYGCDTCCGSFVLDVEGDRLDGRSIDMQGNVIDHFTILKQAQPAGVQPSAAPELLRFALAPNPFSSRTTATFTLDQAEDVTVTVTDALGHQTQSPSRPHGPPAPNPSPSTPSNSASPKAPTPWKSNHAKLGQSGYCG
ncbi:MAG: metallophosphoesterase family protein [Bacteroidia bacterium]